MNYALYVFKRNRDWKGNSIQGLVNKTWNK